VGHGYARFGPAWRLIPRGHLKRRAGARLVPQIAPNLIASGLLAVGGNALDTARQPTAAGAAATSRFRMCQLVAWSLLSQDLAESAHGGRSMTSSLIAPVALRLLAQATLDSSSASHRMPSGLFALAVVALILFVALTGLLVLLARRTVTKSTHAHRHRRRPFVPSGWGLERGIDPDAAATDSVPHPPAR
jgi:hypothetical protein